MSYGETNEDRTTDHQRIQDIKPKTDTTLTKAQALSDLLQICFDQIIPFIRRGENEQELHRQGETLPHNGTALVRQLSLDPVALRARIASSLVISDDGTGIRGFRKTLEDLLDHSVNTTAPGFLDKLYSTPLPPGITAELVLAVLNTNVHVYQVSPVLTMIEKHVTKRLADLFGLNSPRAGGISVTGGSASNLTSIVVARNSLFPETKEHGNTAGGRQLVIFTSAHGHYSVEKSAQALGFGSSAVVGVATDTVGNMRPDELERLILEAKACGKTPFYINATAGTTVLGSFDPFEEISAVAKRHRCWFHIDGAWGGSFIFPQQDDFRAKMKGVHLADSIAINPHKMLGTPVTCSILLARDLRLFHSAMTLKAGYLFHDSEDEDIIQESKGSDDETGESRDMVQHQPKASTTSLYDLQDQYDPDWIEPDDLADMTLQCGRRGDSLKFFMSWQYYGTAGYAEMISAAYDIAVYMNHLVDSNPNLTLVLGPGSKPSCSQVCFYYTPLGHFVFGLHGHPGQIRWSMARTKKDIGKQNTKVTSRISRKLIGKGFMVDFAPALEGQEDKGAFLRVVVNISTIRETAERLIADILEVGDNVASELKAELRGS